ncbi:MAG: hypothetical protein L3J28_07895 [Candidatus Polarisedimenticolaceae bacterium]|nr:hypothetical protein [Candidatus Polarisedimenticolaceae bacterium]
MIKNGLVLLVCLFSLMGGMAQAVAETASSRSPTQQFFEDDEREPSLNEQGIPIGRFSTYYDGVDLKNRSIWLSDYRYNLKAGYRVFGKHSTRISLSSIPLGQQVDVVIKDNSNNTMVPYLVEIRVRR